MGTRKELEISVKSNKSIIKLYQEQLAEDEKELAELDKPVELEHGDYGFGYSGYFRLAVGPKNPAKVDVWNEMNCKNPTGRNIKGDVWLGNIFDDLKMLSEDVEKFEAGRLRVHISTNGYIAITCDKKQFYLTPKDFPAFVKGCRQLEAFQKRKDA